MRKFADGEIVCFANNFATLGTIDRYDANSGRYILRNIKQLDVVKLENSPESTSRCVIKLPDIVGGINYRRLVKISDVFGREEDRAKITQQYLENEGIDLVNKPVALNGIGLISKVDSITVDVDSNYRVNFERSCYRYRGNIIYGYKNIRGISRIGGSYNFPLSGSHLIVLDQGAEDYIIDWCRSIGQYMVLGEVL